MGEAGVYVTRVVDRKVSRGQVFLVCDGGLNHHPSASGNFGQVLRKNYPPDRAAGPARDGRGSGQRRWPLCTPLDLLADRMETPRGEIGDLAVVFQSGAYGRSASPEGFSAIRPVWKCWCDRRGHVGRVPAARVSAKPLHGGVGGRRGRLDGSTRSARPSCGPAAPSAGR